MRIRTAIFGVYVLASSLGFALLMAFILQDVRPRYVEATRRTLQDTAGLLAALLAAEARARPGEDLRQLAEERLGVLAASDAGLRVYVTDAAERVIFDADGGRAVGADYTRSPEMDAYFKSGDAETERASVVDGELRATAPIRSAEALLGYVGVGQILQRVTPPIAAARVRLATGALAIAAVMIFTGWWIAQRLTRSLERLTAYVEAARGSRVGAPPPTRAREIAALGQAFVALRQALDGKDYVERYTQALTHELKAPLAALRGAVELLQEDLPAEERQRFLAHVRAENARLQHIVEQMLELSALEARRGLETPEVCLVAELVDEVQAALQGAWQVRGLRISISPGAGRLSVRGERFLLLRAITNLLQNAIDFSPDGRDLRVEVAAFPGTVRVTIENDGPSIPDYAGERIFERFYSLPRPSTGRKSTGLGLSFVREIAHLHGGAVRVVNRPAGGVRAELDLPAA